MMRLIKRLNLAVLICLSLFANNIYANIHWVWQGSFSQNEQQKLVSWVQQADHGIRTLFGLLPYSYEVYFYHKSGSEPAPWAHTNKGAKKSVHFYVDTQYSHRNFIEDWTAPHELAHLLFPYIGKNSSWFSEGIASYLQYQIMYANNVISWQQAVSKLEERYRAARSYTQHNHISIVKLSKNFHKIGAHVRLYWGGAAYFNHVDKRLFEEKGIRLNDVIRKYLACCSQQQITGAKNMIKLFDQLSKSTVFEGSVTQTVSNKGFPKTQKSSQWLKQNPPKLLNQND